MTGVSMQSMGLGIGKAAYNLPNPPTPSAGMPDFMAMYPYMAAMMASAQGIMAKKGVCDYFLDRGYCMRGDDCPFEHPKQTSDVEARHETGGYASDNEGAHGGPPKKAHFTRRLPSTANTPATRNLSRPPSYSATRTTETPEEPDEPKTPEEPEIDMAAIKCEQSIKQEVYNARIATLKENEGQKAILARKAAEMEAKIAAEKAKLMTKPGGDKILAEISAGRKHAAADDNREADLMILGGTPEPLLRRLSSAQSDAVGYLGRNQAICKYFPNCTNRACTFKHTWNGSASIAAVLCKFFSSCTNRDCLCKHPLAGPTSDVLCKFFPKCTKKGCIFEHPGGRPTSYVQCKFYPSCTNDACTFKHGYGGGSDIECKYYPDCTNPRCIFKHPEGSVRSGSVKRVDNRPKTLLISGVSASFNNGADSVNMVRVAVLAITKYESIQPQSYHDSSTGGEDAYDGLVVTFAKRWQAELVLKGLTMIGGVGRVKCAWYTGRIDGVMADTPRTDLEVDGDCVYGDGRDVDVKMDDHDVKIKDEDLEVAGEDDWGQIS